MNRRAAIRMTDEERDAMLAIPHLNCTLATLGPSGFPQLTAMWFARIDGLLHFATYARSQKIKNLERNPCCSVLIEDGVDYAELRGYSVEGKASILIDPELAGDVMLEITRRRGLLPDDPPEQAVQLIRMRAAKRAVIQLHPVKEISWDHRKLAGKY